MFTSTVQVQIKVGKTKFEMTILPFAGTLTSDYNDYNDDPKNVEVLIPNSSNKGSNEWTRCFLVTGTLENCTRGKNYNN